MAVALLGLLMLSGCRTDMWVQQRVEAQGNSEFYALTDQLVGPMGKFTARVRAQRHRTPSHAGICATPMTHCSPGRMPKATS
jgi:hypothetical protein